MLFVLTSVAHGKIPDFNFPGDLIYGKDDRVEIELYSEDSFIEKSKSIALRVSNKKLTPDRSNPDRILFPAVTLGAAMPNLCESEKFLDQVSLGSCSGFLVGPKTLVTAGHCMKNELDCNGNQWVFGYKKDTTEFERSQIYSCSKIITQKHVYSDKEISDYAIIELDREVENYVPLKRRKFGRVFTETPLVVIGHPLGLPMKATDGGVVSKMNAKERKNKIRTIKLRANYFNTNLDAYAGNSGAPVFNKENGEVEGILIQGQQDFVYNAEKDCHQSKELSNSHMDAAEKVMRINKIPGL